MPGAVVLLGAILAVALMAAPGCDRSPTDAPKVVVLGVDGLDPGLLSALMEDGRTPSFKRMAAMGTFSELETTVPPQSPVAWSSFIIGDHPGKHGIFDFVHRDPKTMQPYLSTSKTEQPGGRVTIGKYRFTLPWDSGGTTLLRHGKAFREVLDEIGVETRIIRIPANYPPSDSATVELSGMGTPDIHGTYGLFSFFTSDPLAFAGEPVSGGRIYHVAVHDNTVESALEGPRNDLLVGRPRTESKFKVYLDPATETARILIGAEERVLKVGEWSDWIPIEFELIRTRKLRAMCRFLLKGVTPEFELYATPLNFDPLAMDAIISTPEEFAAELAEKGGRYYTQGMPEDTAAYTAKVFETHEFLEQASLTGNEIIAQYDRILEDHDRGLLFYYFGNQDQVAHMMWRAMDPDHPAHVPERDGPYRNAITDLYLEYDKLVGRTLDRIDDNTLLVVMSDHGFTSWRRSFDVNAWLKREGYLTLRPGKDQSGPLFADVDWSRTRAYGIGINGLYINLVGREKTGTVMPYAYAGLVQEIRGKLLAEIDPESGKHAITKVYLRDEVYPGTEFTDIAPDLVVGYAKMTRGSSAAALGEVGTEVMFDNLDRWSGSHLMDHEAVPGVLLTNRPLKKKADKLENLAAAILAEFGIKEFPMAREGD